LVTLIQNCLKRYGGVLTMDNARVHYFRCPYCTIVEGAHSKKVSKSVGLFRVKQLYSNVLIFECKRCGKVCRVRMVGSVLKWQDLNPEERKAFQKKQYVNYTKLKLEESS